MRRPRRTPSRSLLKTTAYTLGSLVLVVGAAIVVALCLAPGTTLKDLKRGVGGIRGGLSNRPPQADAIREHLLDTCGNYKIIKWYTPEPAADVEECYAGGYWHPLSESQRTKGVRLVCAIRVEYIVDEGFGQTTRHDDVFVLDYADQVVRVMDSSYVRNRYAPTK